jgi:predicted permease
MVRAAQEIVSDLRYAVRLLARSPAYCLVVILVLAIGIGCNIIVFTIFKSLTISPLSGVPHSGDLHFVGASTSGGSTTLLSYPDYRDLRTVTFPSLAASSIGPFTLGSGADGRRVWAELVSGNYFETLAVRPQLGRLLVPADETSDSRQTVVVLSDALWRRSFGADPRVIGRSIQLNSHSMTVVGIADANFRGSIVGLAADVFAPITTQPMLMGHDWLGDRDNRWVLSFMHVPSGVAGVRARTVAASSSLLAAHPSDDMRARAALFSLWDWPFGAQMFVLPAVSLMGAMSALLLLVVSANVGGLVLVRSIARRGETAVRLAVGASRGRIARLLMTESVVLAAPGALGGFFFPALLAPFLGAAQSNVSLPLAFNIDPDRFVVAFAALLAVITAFVYSVPAIRACRIDIVSVLKDDASRQGRVRGGFRAGLVVAQIAMALLLLVGTALVFRSLTAARATTGGFDARDVSYAAFDLTGRSVDVEAAQRFYRQLLEEVSQEPGVQSATVARYLPLMFLDWQSWRAAPEGYQRPRNEDVAVPLNVVGPDYFRTLQIPIVAGREFTWRDDGRSDHVAIVNETFARRFWTSAAAAIGKRFQTNGGWATIVGVARDSKYARLEEPSRPYFFVPFMQFPDPALTVQVRSSTASAVVLQRLATIAHRLDPSLPVLETGALAGQLRSAVSIYETLSRVLGVIGLLAAGLAALGIYGLIAYIVTQSTHEIGIRSALGASRAAIVRRFLARGLRLTIAGTAVGVAAALALTPSMAALLFGISTRDVVSFAGAVGFVVLVAVAACWVPAWRASKVDPIAALRHQ